MPIELDDDNDLDNEDPKSLRGRLGAEAKARKTAEAELARYKVKDFLEEKGFDLVDPDQLLTVEPGKWAEHAEKLQDQRTKDAEKLLRKALGNVVEDADTLEDMVAEALGKRAAESDTAAQVGRARELSRTQGEPVPPVDSRKLHGRDAIQAALAGKPKS